MNQIKFKLFSMAISILIMTIGLGCSSKKAFKSGIPYQCEGGKAFALEFYDKADIVFLTASGRTSSLHRIPSATGERKYTDGNTILWIKGENASIESYGQTEFKNCFPKPK